MKRKAKNIGGRGYLVSQLRARGLSRRQAVRILNFVFSELRRSLARGREVEFAGGKLKRVERPVGKRWKAMDDHPAHRQQYTVEWEPGPEIWGQIGPGAEK